MRLAGVHVDDKGEVSARAVNLVLGIWLFISAFVLPHLHRGTVWNNALVALVMVFVSLQSFESDTETASEQKAQAT